MFSHLPIVLLFFMVAGIANGAPASNPVVRSSLDLAGLPSLPELPSLTDLPMADLSSLAPGVLNPALGVLNNNNNNNPALQSSGCDVSKIPTVGNFTNSQIIGNWYQLYYGNNVATDILGHSPLKVNDIRYTISEDAFYSTTLNVFLCTSVGDFLGFWTRDNCPEKSVKYELEIRPGGVLRLETPSILKPVLSDLLPSLSLDYIEQRVIALENDFVIFYSCLLPLKDGTCAKNGLGLDIYGKEKQLPAETMSKVKALVDSTCVDFNSLKPVSQEQSYPFFVPTGADLLL